MQSLEKPVIKHWSVHPWKLAGVVAALYGVVLPVAVSLMTTVLVILPLVLIRVPQDLPNAPASSADAVVWALTGALLVVMLAASILVALFILRSQARHALEDRAQNRVGWIALPGFLTALALSLHSLLQPSPGDSYTAPAMVAAFSVLALPLATAQAALKAALLLPVWRRQTSLAVGALILAAISFIPSLPVRLIQLISGTPLFPWFFTELASALATALVAAALFEAVRRRMWDALALLWGLACLLNNLAALWDGAGAAAVSGQGDIHRLILWAVPTLVALVYLLMRDRRAARTAVSTTAQLQDIDDETTP